jgi:nitronate monooxygenase
VPIVITSLGARPSSTTRCTCWGGITLHDVIDDRFAHKAIEKGADGLILVATGAGGHAGRLNPFAFVQEVREWFDGPLILSGAIATGRAILAAQVLGADLAYIGSPFIATDEANAVDAYKQASSRAVRRTSSIRTCSPACTAITCASSIVNAGLDPDKLPESDPSAMNFGGAKAWKEIWGSGQGIGAVDRGRVPAAVKIERLKKEYAAAKAALG